MTRTGIETPDAGANDFYARPPEEQAAAELDERTFVDPTSEADATAAERTLRHQEELFDDPNIQDKENQPGQEGDQQ
jgi:hypothetical protein